MPDTDAASASLTDEQITAAGEKMRDQLAYLIDEVDLLGPALARTKAPIYEAKAAADQPSLKEALFLLALRDRNVRIPLVTGQPMQDAQPDNLEEQAHAISLEDLITDVQASRRELVAALPTDADGWKTAVDVPGDPLSRLAYAHQIVLVDTDLLRDVALHLFDLQRVAG